MRSHRVTRHPTQVTATQHKWTCPVLTSNSQVGTQFTYTGGMEGWPTQPSQCSRPITAACWPPVRDTVIFQYLDAVGIQPVKVPPQQLPEVDFGGPAYPGEIPEKNNQVCSFIRLDSKQCCILHYHSQHHSTFGDRAFAAAVPGPWNSLPPRLGDAVLPYSRFRRSLKTLQCKLF